MGCFFRCLTSSASDSPSGTIDIGGISALSSVNEAEPQEPSRAAAPPDSAPLPPLRLPSSAGMSNQCSRAQFTARLDLDNDDVASTCWLSDPPLLEDEQRLTQVLFRPAAATAEIVKQRCPPSPSVTGPKPAPAAGVMQNSKVQAELPVVMTPFKGQRLVELHEDPDTPTKIAEALIKQTDEEQTECWLNSGSPPQQSKGFQRPSVQKASSQLAGKQEGRGKKSNTAMEEPDVQIRHRMMPSDVPEHLVDLLLNHERPKMHAAPHEIDSSSSVTSASSASGIEIQLNPISMQGSIFGGASSHVVHSPYSLKNISTGGGITSNIGLNNGKAIPPQTGIGHDITLQENHQRLTACREVKAATPSPASTASVCQGSSVQTGATAPDEEEVSSTAAMPTRKGGSKTAPKKKTLIPRKGNAALFSQIPDTERRIEAGRKAMSAGSGGSTPQSTRRRGGKQQEAQQWPSSVSMSASGIEGVGPRENETTEAMPCRALMTAQPTAVQANASVHPSGITSGYYGTTVYCFDSPSLHSPGPSPVVGQHYPSYASPLQYGGLSSSPMQSPATPANANFAQPKRVAAAARPISHTLLGQSLAHRVALAIAPPGKDT